MELLSFLPPDILKVLTITVIALIVIITISISAIVYGYAFRKLWGDMQFRYSIMRVGPHGLLQLIADALKFFLKEDIVPNKADRFLFVLAPFLFFVPFIMLLMTVPVSETFVAMNLELGLFFFFAFLTVLPIGLILAGWASNSKYSLIGGLRAAAQQLSYEIPLLIAVIGVIMLSSSLNFGEIVAKQAGVITINGFKTFIPNWFIILQPFGFLIFFVAALADTHMPPFDLPEGESEIVAGPFTEYSGIKYFLFLMVEQFAVIVISVVIAILYLGGWNGPFLPPVVWLLLKTAAILWLIIWTRVTLPRLRIDQLMNLGWKVLLPLTLANLTITGILILGS